MQIHNRVFFITGGGSGLGAATARLLAGSGAYVVMGDLNDEGGENVAGALGEDARFVHTDVTDEESVQTALDTTLDAFGGLHGLVNCAGVGPAIKVLGRKGPHPLEDFRKTVEINLVGTFNSIRLAAHAVNVDAVGRTEKLIGTLR